MNNKYKKGPVQDNLQSALREAFRFDARRLTVFAALILAIIQARSVVLYNLKTHVQLPGTLSTRYQRLLRFMKFVVSDESFLRFALKFLPSEEPLDLIIDRTNWKLGKVDINILLVSAVWKGFSLPLVWSLLPHGGLSSQMTRIGLLERLFAAHPDLKVRSLLADREFIGKKWFAYLQERNIDPCIRLPKNARLGAVRAVPVWAYFKNMQPGEIRHWYKPTVIYGVTLRVAASCSPKGEVIYLAYKGHAAKKLKLYLHRWQAENLHSALKTRGFNLEDTGLDNPQRISTLLAVVSVAFMWACYTGALLASKTILKLKKHGYAQVSIFRLGLDYLQDLLLHPSSNSSRALVNLFSTFEE